MHAWVAFALLAFPLPAAAGGSDADAPPAPPAGRLIPDGVGETKYLCVFGPDGDPRYGATDGIQILFFAVPASSSAPLAVHVYDPVSGGRLEYGTRQYTPVVTRFSVFGGQGAFSDPASRAARPQAGQPGTMLASELFEGQGQSRWVTLGRFGREQGERVGETVYYKLVVTGTAGGSANLFRVAVSPHTVDVFTYELSITVSRSVTLSVGLSSSLTVVREHNFDPDASTVCFLNDAKLERSRNGRWAENEVALPARSPGDLVRYRVSRTWPGDDHVAFYLTDPEGNALPICFGRPWTGP